MSGFTKLILDKLMNRGNIVSRVENLEAGNGARPSATITQLSQMGGLTGNLSVDGYVVVVDRSTGAAVITIDDDGIKMVNSSNAWFNFQDAGGNYGTVNIANTPSNDFEIVNLATSPSGTISFFLKDTSGTTRRVMHLKEDTTDVMRVEMGIDHFFPLLNSSSTDSVTAYINERGKRINTIIKDASNVQLLKTDADNSLVYVHDTAIHIPFYGHGLNATVGVGGVMFAPLQGVAGGGLNATGYQIPVQLAGTIRGLTVRINTAQPGTGSLVCTMMVNGGASALAVTIAAGSVAGNYTTSSTLAVSAGDLIVPRLVNNAAGASAQVGVVSFYLA